MPDPGPDPVSEIHPVPDDDVQAHVESVVTLTLPVAPAGGTVTVSGATVYVHVAACWVTPKLLPAIVNVAVLDCVVELDTTVIPTLPEPVRVPPPLVIVAHDDPPDDVQVQLAPVVTVTVTVPPAAVNV